MKLKAADRLRLERALCTLADYERVIKLALTSAPGVQGSDWDHRNVCAALRALVDDRWEPTR